MIKVTVARERVGTLEGLISLAANTVVAAATTDAWDATGRKLARLLGCGDPKKGQLAGKRLEQTRQQLEGVSGPELEQAQADLRKVWQVRLADLLEEHPELAAELRALVMKIRTQLPTEAVAAADQAAAAGRYVDISALQAALAAVMLHGEVMPPDPTRPGLVRSSPGPRPGSLSPTRSLAPRAERRSVSWCSTARWRVRPYR
jgi:hypothetical protein